MENNTVEKLPHIKSIASSHKHCSNWDDVVEPARPVELGQNMGHLHRNAPDKHHVYTETCHQHSTTAHCKKDIQNNSSIANHNVTTSI